MKKRVFFYIGVVCSAMMVSSCATLGSYNPATGRSEFIYISTQEEVSMGNTVHQDILKDFKLSKDSKMVSRVERIGQELALVSDRQDYQYKFYVVEKDELNAFTTPGGNIYVFTGLLKRFTDDQLASVIAHEIGHCAAKHTVKKFQAALGVNLVGSILLSQIDGGSAQQIANLSSKTITNLVFSAYGRSDEYEADRLGVKYMYLAGRDLNGVIESLEILQKESKGPKVPTILRTHPHLDDRIGAVKKEIAAVATRYSQKQP